MRRTQAGYRYYLCRGRTDALRAAQGQRCTTRYTPAEQLDQLVWSDLCALLGDPAQVAQTLDGDQLVEKLRERLEAGPCHFHVLVPATPLDQLAPHLGYEDPTKGEPMASAEELGRSAARQRLHEELPRLRRLGAEVDGEVGEADLGCRHQGGPERPAGRRDHPVDAAAAPFALACAGPAEPGPARLRAAGDARRLQARAPV